MPAVVGFSADHGPVAESPYSYVGSTAIDMVEPGFGVAPDGVPTIQLRSLRLDMTGVALLIVSVTETSSLPPVDHSKPSTSVTLAL